jgi:DNA-binding NarL/FixJ family response regulator
MPPLKHIFQSSSDDEEPALVATIQVNFELMAKIKREAAAEGVAVQPFIEELLTFALNSRQSKAQLLEIWLSLTEREQQITALTCLGSTNPEIAQTLTISVNTVKFYIRHILRKYNVSRKRELQRLLKDWDLEKWFNEQYYP